MDIIVHGVKKENRLKKFMQVKVDVKCMWTKFGGCVLSSFCFFSFAVKTEVDVKCMHTNFGAPLVLKILLLSISFKISF